MYVYIISTQVYLYRKENYGKPPKLIKIVDRLRRDEGGAVGEVRAGLRERARAAGPGSAAADLEGRPDLGVELVQIK